MNGRHFHFGSQFAICQVIHAMRSDNGGLAGPQWHAVNKKRIPGSKFRFIFNCMTHIRKASLRGLGCWPPS